MLSYTMAAASVTFARAARISTPNRLLPPSHDLVTIPPSLVRLLIPIFSSAASIFIIFRTQHLQTPFYSFILCPVALVLTEDRHAFAFWWAWRGGVLATGDIAAACGSARKEEGQTDRGLMTFFPARHCVPRRLQRRIALPRGCCSVAGCCAHVYVCVCLPSPSGVTSRMPVRLPALSRHAGHSSCTCPLTTFLLSIYSPVTIKTIPHRSSSLPSPLPCSCVLYLPSTCLLSRCLLPFCACLPMSL